MNEKIKLGGECEVFVCLTAELSTAHMTQQDNDILEENSGKGSKHPLLILSYEHGFMVSAWHDLQDPCHATPEGGDGTLVEALAAWGHSTTFCYVMHRLCSTPEIKWAVFDTDIDPGLGLPTEKW
jgi:hypothetical protein